MSAESPDNYPISEGMQHGPFPPPELDSNPDAAQQVMARAEGDPQLYQLLRLRNSLIQAKADGLIDDEVFTRNWDRINNVIEPITRKNEGIGQVNEARFSMAKGRRQAWLKNKAAQDSDNPS